MKRFTIKEIDNFSYGIKVTDLICDDGIELPQSTVCDMLNDLWEENHHLQGKASSWKIVASEEIRQKGELIKEIGELKKENKKLKKENEELKSIKRFAENQGINIFEIDDAFYKCWNDNKKLTMENRKMTKISEYDIKLLLEYIDSCLSTDYNQEMTWNQLKAYHSVRETLIEKGVLEDDF